MTTTATVYPYAGSTPKELVYNAPVQIDCTVRLRGRVVELEPDAGHLCPLWSVLVLMVVSSRYKNGRPRKVRAVAIQREGDRVVIRTEAMVQ